MFPPTRDQERLSIDRVDQMYSKVKKHLTATDTRNTGQYIHLTKQNISANVCPYNIYDFNIRLVGQLLVCGVWNKYVHNGTIAAIANKSPHHQGVQFTRDVWKRPYYSKVCLVPINTQQHCVTLNKNMFGYDTDRLTLVDLTNETFLQLDNVAMNRWLKKSNTQLPYTIGVDKVRTISKMYRSSYMTL